MTKPAAPQKFGSRDSWLKLAEAGLKQAMPTSKRKGVYIYMYVYVYMYIHMYIHMYVHMYVYIYIYIHTYGYLHGCVCAMIESLMIYRYSGMVINPLIRIDIPIVVGFRLWDG